MLPTTAFDRYRPGESLAHRLDPRVKVIVTVLFILSNVLLPDGAWLALLAAWGLLLLAARLSRLSPGFLLRRSLLALPFALAAVTVLFSQPGQTLWTLQAGAWTLTISDAGLVRFTSILARSWLSVQMAILLTATTTFPDLMHALRHLRVPAVLVAILGFMYRYLFVLADEATRLLRARAARSARIPRRVRAPHHAGVARSVRRSRRRIARSGGSVWWRARVAGSMVGQLFLRSYERSERVYGAMLARGYHGHMMTMNPHVMTRGDWLAGLGAVALLAGIQLIARLPQTPWAAVVGR